MTLEPDNTVAGEAILFKLNRVAQMAESLDNVLKEIGVLCQSDGLSSWSNVEEVAEPAKNRNNRSASEDSTAKFSSDQESAVTAPLWNPQSRSSSYHTASECRSSPWWDSEKNSDDLEVEPTGMVRIRPAGTSSASNSFDESDHSLMSTSFQCDSDESPKTPLSHRDDGEDEEEEEETSTSTISQTSRKPSIIPNEKVIIDESGKLSVETITPETDSVSPVIIESSAKVSGNENDRQPDFMAWNRYYQSLINKQTLRSCL